MTETNEDIKIVIVGAGFSGLCMAIQLQKHSIHDFILIEKSNAVGGTWWENKYPGAECDVESHLYSFSFEPNPNWSRIFSSSDEIQQYLHSCTNKYHLYSKIHFNEIVKENQWTGNHWIITTNQRKYKCQFLVFSSSPLHYPSFPNILGVKEFEGKILHTSRWDRNYDFKGKRVGMIGCGASGIQAVPFLQQNADHLIVHQRTPQWIVPKGNRNFWWIEKFLFTVFPWWGSLYRWCIYYYHEILFNLFFKNSLLAVIVTWFCKANLAMTIKDPELRKKLTPNYPIGCKRVLLTDDFYQSLDKPNVTVLVGDSIDRITKDAMIVNGKEYKMDVLVLATGFDITGGINAVKIVDTKTGKDTSEAIEQFYGVYVRDMKNFFTLLGTNSGSTYTSVILYIESQVNHIIDVIQYMNKEDKNAVQIHPKVFEDHNKEIQAKSKLLVLDQCKSWYLRDNKNVALYPDTVTSFDQSLSKLSFENSLIFE